jgi:hypothetical protein
MKNLLLTFGILFATIAFAQDKTKIFLIVNDSIDVDKTIYARLLIINEHGFSHPSKVEIFHDPVSSNFGIIEFEKYDNLKKKFISYNTHISVSKFEQIPSLLNKSDSLNCKFLLVNKNSLNAGIYRTRVKILLSRYNTIMVDCYSNWSYLYVGN